MSSFAVHLHQLDHACRTCSEAFTPPPPLLEGFVVLPGRRKQRKITPAAPPGVGVFEEALQLLFGVEPISELGERPVEPGQLLSASSAALVHGEPHQVPSKRGSPHSHRVLPSTRRGVRASGEWRGSFRISDFK
jgi:hypothetical protein